MLGLLRNGTRGVNGGVSLGGSKLSPAVGAEVGASATTGWLVGAELGPCCATASAPKPKANNTPKNFSICISINRDNAEQTKDRDPLNQTKSAIVPKSNTNTNATREDPNRGEEASPTKALTIPLRVKTRYPAPTHKT